MAAEKVQALVVEEKREETRLGSCAARTFSRTGESLPGVDEGLTKGLVEVSRESKSREARISARRLVLLSCGDGLGQALAYFLRGRFFMGRTASMDFSMRRPGFGIQRLRSDRGEVGRPAAA